jgi:hypothetical protein
MGEGFGYRRLLDSPRCERLSKKMDAIYRTVDLDPDDRARLLKLHVALMRAYYAVLSDKECKAAMARAPEWSRQHLASRMQGGVAMFKLVERDFEAFAERVGAGEDA